MSFELLCPRCNSTTARTSVTPGAVAPCACGGNLTLPKLGVFTCPSCKLRSKPAVIPLHTTRPCPKCAIPLVLHSIQETDKILQPKQPGSDLPTIMQTDAPSANPTTPKAKPSPAQGLPSADQPLFTTWTPDGDKSNIAPASASVATVHGSTPGANTLAVGSKFGRYIIRKELARGGMGIVSIAHDPQLKRDVALKVLIAGDLATPDAIARFVREARAAGMLRHPNIISVHDAGQIDGRHFFTMDLIDGKELADVMAKKAYNRRQFLEWMHTVALALHHAHTNGIIHRDLKPQNIVIDTDGRPIVMDFGLAKDFSSKTFQSMSGAIFGTPAYMSPEQARGDTRTIDHRSDIYSLGVILYEGATGRRPFGGDTLFDTMRAVVNDEPLSPHNIQPDIDADFDTVILRCLEKDPAQRYQTAQAFADDIQALLDDRPVEARPIAAPVRVWRKLRRKPVLLVSVASAIIVGGLTIALWLHGSLLSRIAAEIRLNQPPRTQAALTLLKAEWDERRLSKGHATDIMTIVAPVLNQDAASATQAVELLSQFQLPGTIDLLLPLVTNSEQPLHVRSAAAIALATCTPEEQHPHVADLLSQAASDCADATFAQHAITTAMACDPTATMSIIEPALLDSKRDPRWRSQVITAIGFSRPSLHGPTMHLLLRLAGDPDPRVGDAAARALETTRTREHVLPFYGLEGNSAQAVAGLGRMAQAIAERDRLMNEELRQSDNNASPVTTIAAQLSSGDTNARIAAAYDLGQLHDAEAITPLTHALRDPISAVRRNAARSLAQLQSVGEVPAAPILGLLTTNTGDADLRRDTMYAAGLLQLSAAIPLLTTVSANVATTDQADQRAAIIALGLIADPAIVPGLQQAWDQAVTTKNTELASVIVEALSQHQAHRRSALPTLIQALEFSDPAVRSLALDALQRTSGESFGPQAQRWRDWLHHTQPQPTRDN